MVLARQIEVERCLETKRNRAAILRGLERKQICKVQPCEWDFCYNKSVWFLSCHTDRKQEEYIYILKAKGSLQSSGQFLNECNDTECVLGPKQSHSTFSTAPFLVQHLVSGICECENQNNTCTTIAPLGCLFHQGIFPFPQAVAAVRWRQAAARCDIASGHKVIWSQENKMLDAGSITHKIAAPKNSPPPFVQVPLCPGNPIFSKVSLKKRFVIYIQALLRRK